MKGQSAVEQVITYGWAAGILVVLIGTLLYSGALSAFGGIAERCVFQNGFVCAQSRLYSGPDGSTALDLTFRNALSRKIEVTGILCSAEPPNPSLGYPARGLALLSPPVEINSEGSRDFTMNCFGEDGTTAPNSERTYNGIVYVRYKELDSSFGSLPVGERMKMANAAGKVN